MKIFKKILISLFWFTLIGSLIVLMGFINDKNGELTLRSIEITIDRQEPVFLLTEEDVMGIIGNQDGEMIGKPFSGIPLESIENRIKANQYVLHVNVYSTIPGNIYIDITQRIPLVRVVNEKYEHFYISTDGHLMALKPEVIIPMILASGMIADSLNKTITLRKVKGYQVLEPAQISILETIYNLAGYIQSHEFMKAQIEQIYINESQEVEMFPKVGNHVIIFGSLENMEGKFNKLMAFYMEGIRYSGWDMYKSVNLKFRNQIVCIK